jgi:hypothetical protein
VQAKLLVVGLERSLLHNSRLAHLLKNKIKSADVRTEKEPWYTQLHSPTNTPKSVHISAKHRYDNFFDQVRVDYSPLFHFSHTLSWCAYSVSYTMVHATAPPYSGNAAPAHSGTRTLTSLNHCPDSSASITLKSLLLLLLLLLLLILLLLLVPCNC